MKKLITSLLVLGSLSVFSQEPIKGFKDIILGDNIRSIRKYTWPISQDSKLDKKTKWYEYTKPGSALFEHLTLEGTTIKTESDTIKQIVVKFNPYDKGDMLMILSDKYGVPDDSGTWKIETGSIILSDNRAIFNIKNN